MLKVLIVEDDPDKKRLIISFFKNNGIYGPSIDVCEDVTCALKYLRTYKYDILCLDLNLPLRNNEQPKDDGGLTILNKLSNPQYQKPSYIFGLTSFNNIKDKQSEYFKRYDFNLYSYSEDIWKDILENKLNWIKESKRQESNLELRSNNKVINILVHGVMTSGMWQKELARLTDSESMMSICHEYKYYSVLKIMNYFTRKKQVKDFSDFLELVLIQYPNVNINLVGHSFGTFLIVNALDKMELDNLTRINYVILSGSVVRSDYDFKKIIKKYAIKNIVNDCAVNDIPLIFSKLFCFGLGHGGRIGFNSCSTQIVNRYHKAGHSMYASTPTFIDMYWASILRDGNIIDGSCHIDYGVNKFINPIIGVLNPYIMISLIIACFFVVC